MKKGGPTFAPSIVQFHCFAAEVVVRLKISGREVDGMSLYLIGAPTSFHGPPPPPRYSDTVSDKDDHCSCRSAVRKFERTSERFLARTVTESVSSDSGGKRSCSILFFLDTCMYPYNTVPLMTVGTTPVTDFFFLDRAWSPIFCV